MSSKRLDHKYCDLVGYHVYTYVVKERVDSDSEAPEMLRDTKWILQCTCGRTRKLKGTTVFNQAFKECICSPSTKPIPEGSYIVGRGAVHLMMNDKSRFMEYLQSRESQRSSYNRHPYIANSYNEKSIQTGKEIK